MPPSSPLARLWMCAHSAITALCASLSPLDTLVSAERRKLRGWLRALEAFCRRLALAEALARLGDAHSPTGLSTHAARSALSVRHTERTAAKRKPSLRLWPKPRRPAARIRLLGPPSSVREIEAERRRAALTARLAEARQRPAHLRLADRLEALERFLDAPARAIARFARKLRHTPALAFAIVAAGAPACPFLTEDDLSACDSISTAAVMNTS